MIDVARIAASTAGGGALGAIFFGGLWWTVRRGMESNRPALWFAGSLLARTGLVVLGFYAVSQGDWQRLVGCLCGFLAARLVVTQCSSRPHVAAGPSTQIPLP